MVSLQAGLFVVGAGCYLLRAAAAAAALGLCSALSAQIRESSAAAWWQGCLGAGLRVRFRGVALAFVAGVAAPFGGLAAAPAPAAGVLDALERGLAAVARHDLVVVGLVEELVQVLPEALEGLLLDRVLERHRAHLRRAYSSRVLKNAAGARRPAGARPRGRRPAR